MPDPLPSYRAARDSAAVFDMTGVSLLDLSGRDSVSFLNNFCTNDIKKLAPGAGCEAFVTNVKARVLAHILAFRDQEPGDGLTIVAPAGQGTRLAEHLDRYLIREEVTIRDCTPEYGLLLVLGPRAAKLLRGAGIEPPENPGSGGSFTSRTVPVGEIICPIRGIDLFGVPGYLIEMRLERIDGALEVLLAAGIEAGEPSAFDVLRLEAAFPLYGIDVTDDHLAPEVGRPWAISYTKGCYLGQEPIARIDALGHVNRLLRGLRIESGPALEPGAAILAEDKEIGAVTSAAAHPAGGAVALGYVRAKFAEAGTGVIVRTSEGERPATVFGPIAPGEAG